MQDFRFDERGLFSPAYISIFRPGSRLPRALKVRNRRSKVRHGRNGFVLRIHYGFQAK
jgi:hypothetical protein